MLKKLQIKFVVVIMVLVGAVLVSVLGGSFVSAWQTQRNITYEALERSVNGSIYDLPRIRVGDGEGNPGDGPRANMLMLVVDVDEDGIVLATNDSPLSFDSETLAFILKTALSSDTDTAWDEELHVAWMRVQRSNSAWRVVIADTSQADISLRTLAIQDIAIIVIAMVALLLIAIGLSTWMIKPVGEAWEQQRRFVADASHELKTPLAVIIANTQILANDTSIPAESQRWISSTADESEHMKNLVEELLELARTDESNAGTQGILQKERVDFSTMVESASLEFDAIAFERGTLIEEDIEQGITVVGDPTWLMRLCKILVDNACKYSQVGSPITVRLARESRRCVLTVNNHGSVIDPEDLPHVFDRFYRTDKARSRDEQTGGFGLGLAIAKGIVTSHGGEISVASNEQDGTTFRVVLPAVQAER